MSALAGLFDRQPSEILMTLSDLDPRELELVRMTASNRAIRAEPSVTDEDRLAWASVAQAAISQLRVRPFGPREDLERSDMRLRAALIHALGGEAGDALRDPEVVVDWFLDSLGSESIESVQLDVERPRGELALDRVRRLRAIKNNLAVVALMSRPDRQTSDASPRDERLVDWLDLRTRLP